MMFAPFLFLKSDSYVLIREQYIRLFCTLSNEKFLFVKDIFVFFMLQSIRKVMSMSKLRELRKAKNMTQSELAKEINVSEKTI
ncbi:helix-turn-helix domain-containing protein, partial [Streptococcus thermophilus]|nr:helix-turn-helix domain-containing protein [Streptococcus thermophilus]